MARLLQPTSTKLCIDFLAQTTTQSDLLNDKRFNKISVWFDTAKRLYHQFIEARLNYRNTNHLLQEKRSEAKASIRKLSLTVRHFDTSLTQRILRNEEPHELLNDYGIAQQREAVRTITPIQWRRMAQDRINGEVKAIAKGYEPMSNPSIADLQACLEHFDTSGVEVNHLDRLLQDAQDTIKQLRTETLNLWRVLQANLSAVTPELQGGSKRRLLRSFGYIYRPDSYTAAERAENRAIEEAEARVLADLEPESEDEPEATEPQVPPQESEMGIIQGPSAEHPSPRAGYGTF